jgi:hypothetical protein
MRASRVCVACRGGVRLVHSVAPPDTGKRKGRSTPAWPRIAGGCRTTGRAAPPPTGRCVHRITNTDAGNRCAARSVAVAIAQDARLAIGPNHACFGDLWFDRDRVPKRTRCAAFRGTRARRACRRGCTSPRPLPHLTASLRGRAGGRLRDVRENSPLKRDGPARRTRGHPVADPDRDARLSNCDGGIRHRRGSRAVNPNDPRVSASASPLARLLPLRYICESAKMPHRAEDNRATGAGGMPGTSPWRSRANEEDQPEGPRAQDDAA